MTRGRVILITPPLRASKERQYAKMGQPRLGLGYLAAYLTNQDINVEIIDAKFQGLNFRQVIDRIKERPADLIGITALTPEIVDAATLATGLKQELPDSLIVIGGPHANALPVQTLQEFPWFDFLVYGEGEITLYELVLALGGKKTMEEVKGLVFRGNGIKLNEPRPYLNNLDELPFPAWHLLPRAEQYPILAARGCPFRCIFCARTLGNKVRLRSPRNIVDEMEVLYENYHPGSIGFNDDTFGMNRRHSHELFDLIKERGLATKVKWYVETRVDVVDFEFLRRLKEAGCPTIGFGIESGNEKALDAIGKGTTLEQAERAVTLAKKARLRTHSFFILGHPYETEQTARDTIDFALRLNTSRANFGIMVPYPGTEIARMVERGEGNYRVLSRDWADYGKQIGNVLELTALSRTRLEQLQFTGYVKFYLLNGFSFDKLRRLLKLVGWRSIIAYGFWILSRSLHLRRAREGSWVSEK